MFAECAIIVLDVFPLYIETNEDFFDNLKEKNENTSRPIVDVFGHGLTYNYL